MQAIIVTGGKQYNVKEGDVLFIEKLNVEADATVTFDQVLAVLDGENSKIGAGSVVLEEVPPNSTVVGVPGHVIQRGDTSSPRETLDQTDLPDPVQEDITLLKKENTELTSRLLMLEDEVKRLKKSDK